MPNLRGLQKSVFALKTGPRAKEGHVEQKKGGGMNLTFPLFPKKAENILPIHFSRECKDIFFSPRIQLQLEQHFRYEDHRRLELTV